MKYNAANRKSLPFFVLVLVLLSFPQCMEEDSSVPAGQGWTSEDPVSIPFRQRLMQFEKGNLVKNPSFEHGRLINLDSNTVSYNITSWKGMGENLIWVEHLPDSNGKVPGVHSGSYSIKISRSLDDESINKGEGIVSDFIRVIPGNYEFSFWIRLQDIHPNRAQGGTRINDAVNIRLLFYDKNRLLMSGNKYNPGRKAVIDLSFKALPFSNFWNIDSLGWTRVMGLTTCDFLTEGDIPDEAKYVKIYMGLNGTGTMWIDDVDFRYTKRNFTSLERTRSMFDTICTKPDMVIPRPKLSRSHPPVTYHIQGTDSIPMPVILLPPAAEKQTRMAARLLKSRLDDQFAGSYGKDSLPGIRIIRQSGAYDPGDGGLIFSIGKNSRSDVFLHLKKHRSGKQRDSEEVLLTGEPAHTGKGLHPVDDWIPGKQGYIIRPDSAFPNLIHLTGASAQGDYYAAATAVQLLDDSLFLFHSAGILDYPDIPERAFLVSPVAAASNPIDYSPYLAEMAGLKLNWAYLDFYHSRTLWQQESRAYLQGLKVIGKESSESAMLQLAQMFNPYAFLPGHSLIDSLGPEAGERWSHSGYSSRAKLLKYYSAGLKSGVSTIVLCSPDYLPASGSGNYLLFAPGDKDKYINLQEAHLDLIGTLYKWVSERDQGIRLEFIAPWYSNEDLDLSRGQAEQYFNDLSRKLPDDLRILWSGPARQSHTINSLDFHRFHELAGRELVLMDNSMNTIREILADTASIRNRPMIVRTLNLFDPFSVHFSESFTLPEGTGRMLINSPLSSEIMKIRIATAADFMWNMDSYDPDLSIWKVLVSMYGINTTRELYSFNDAYFSALASVIGLKKGQDQQKHLRLIGEQLLLMEGSLETLGRLPGFDGGLLNELKSLKQSLESLYDKEMKTVAGQIIAAMESM